jgi:hypothetical protein
VRAAKELGWEEIEVWVREDLDAEGDVAVELRLIGDNLHRRHLDKLDLARSYRRLRELEQNLPREKRHLSCGGDLRDVIARKLGGQSGRNHDRYLRVLETPTEVQEAFSQGKLSLIEAGRVAGLSPDVQDRIAVTIRAGEKPKEMVKRFLKEQEPAQERVRRQLSLVGSILRSLDTLKDENPSNNLDSQTLSLLREVRKELAALLEG